MDASVLAALAKWPNVPAVFGWLQLTARGQWRIRGERIDNAALNAFISRNYASDAQGRWFFQNGPQRVYVELEATPWIWLVDTSAAASSPCMLLAHTSAATGIRPAQLQAAWIDETGRVLLQTELGIGLMHSADTAYVAEALCSNEGTAIDGELLARWVDGDGTNIRPVMSGESLGLPQRVPVERIRSETLPERFRFQPRPSATA